MRFQCTSLTQARSQWRALSKIQNVWTQKEYLEMLKRYAEKAGYVMTAWDGRKLAASFMWLQAPIDAIEGLRDACEEDGIDPDKVLIPGGIFVAPDFKGGGISFQILRESEPHMLAQGYTQSLWAFYATTEIWSWTARLSGKTSTGLLDPNGDLTYWIPVDKLADAVKS